MLSNTMIQVGIYLTALLLLTKPMGLWIAKVMNGESSIANKLGGPTERLIYRALGIKPEAEMGWKHYAIALMLFNVIGIIAVYFLQRWQVWLPLNPQHFPAVSIDSSLDTAISFVTNTN